MTVRLKAAALVVVSFVIAFVAITLVSQSVLVPSYASLEKQHVHTSLAQALQTMGTRLDRLDVITHDWASWDDTYDYVHTSSPEYVDSNLLDDTFATLGINVTVILDELGNTIFARAYDLERLERTDVPRDLVSHLSPDGCLATRSGSGEPTIGILSLADGVMLVSAHPILTSAETGPPRGTFVMGAFVSSRMMEEISDITLLPVSILSLGESAIAPSGSALPPFTAPSDIAVMPLSSDDIMASSIVNDLYGRPVLTVSIVQSRDIYAEGQQSLSFLLTIIACGLAMLAVLFLVLFDRAIFSRLSRLATNVRVIGEQPDFSGEVPVDGDDDIAFLAETINQTLRALARTHHQLEESHSQLETANADLQRAQQELGTSASKLRRLTVHVQTMREDEQAFVAKEIHDQIGQGLTAVKMDLDSVERTCARGGTPPPQFLKGITDVVDSLLETVRRLSSGLRPSTLEDLGIADGFEWQIAEFGRERAIKTSCVVQGPTADVEAGRALTLFRILQEALLACAEDPATSEVSVSLAIENGYALLALHDNGRTILQGEALARREIGVSLIRERAEIFGGGVSVDHSPESGTSIVAQLPL